MGMHDEAKLDTKFVDFARQMNLYLNHFPKFAQVQAWTELCGIPHLERHAVCAQAQPVHIFECRQTRQC